ncbi:MAG: hypothetical protein HRT44_11520 [Bdellovibrionales bacterium]|nr:hypothetical protein [Bdellovibrionales bacterium]
MNKYVKKIGLLFTSLSFAQQGQANINNINNLDIIEDFEGSEMNDFTACNTLLDLEHKNILSEKQLELGQLVHDIIEQISDSPLDYCENISMNAVIERPPK